MPTRAEIMAMITVIKPEKEPSKKSKDAPVPKRAKKPTKTQLAEAIENTINEPTKRTVTKRSDYPDNGHWSFDSRMGQKPKFGFIYVIRDLRNGKAYIGKKQYRGAGPENFGKESNWPWYISSRDTLVDQIKLFGKEHFEFIVLEEYESNKALGYAETWSLMFAETPSNQDKWYNRLVNKVSWFCKEQITQRHKDRLTAIIKNEPITHTVSIQ